VIELLKGVRVIECAVLFNGDQPGRHLADLGADVIKVEALEVGDYLRDFLGQIAPHHSPAHMFVNRNNRSITLNLRSHEGRQVFYQLLKTATSSSPAARARSPASATGRHGQPGRTSSSWPNEAPSVPFGAYTEPATRPRPAATEWGLMSTRNHSSARIGRWNHMTWSRLIAPPHGAFRGAAAATPVRMSDAMACAHRCRTGSAGSWPRVRAQNRTVAGSAAEVGALTWRTSKGNESSRYVNGSSRHGPGPSGSGARGGGAA